MENHKNNSEDYNTHSFPTWCPGCGDWGIWMALKNALAEGGFKTHETVIVFGIGCSGNMANTVKVYGFHALHGRSLPVAAGVKLANHDLKVIVVAGDGDCYGEGGNHFIHAARANHDITLIVHDNRVYGLTTGQTSPTSPKDFKTKSTPHGAPEVPMNPLALALISGASFIARGFAGDVPHLTEVLGQALAHKGFALVDIFQPCVTFNHTNTYEWYRERMMKLEKAGHNPESFSLALERSLDTDKLPIGVFYANQRPAYHQTISQITDTPLVELDPRSRDMAALIKRFV